MCDASRCVPLTSLEGVFFLLFGSATATAAPSAYRRVFDRAAAVALTVAVKVAALALTVAVAAVAYGGGMEGFRVPFLSCSAPSVKQGQWQWSVA